MAELRSVDPRTLQPNPNNPRRTPVPPAMDEQLIASIKAVGIIQPPCVTPKDDGLMIVIGNRRVKASIKAELPVIDVLVCDADEAADAMRSVAENLIRASMSSVDIWRAIERLEAQGWNEQAIGDALALPVRTVRRLKLLAHLHPPMLDVMALGSMPNEEQLRIIAAATREEQAQVWKKPGMRSPAPSPSAACRPRPPNSATISRRLTASSGRTTCSPRRERTAATPPTSRGSSAPSRSGCRTTCRSAAPSCR
jgi:ParB/RepB/Spo0J family partition protein